MLELELTRQDSNTKSESQTATADSTRGLAADVAAGIVPRDTVLFYGPTVWILNESMDSYRDLMASGGTTRVRSLDVRRTMSRVQKRVDYIHTTEGWALDLHNSLRAGMLASSTPLSQDNLAQVWASYDEIDQALLEGHARLVAAVDSALSVLREELASR